MGTVTKNNSSKMGRTNLSLIFFAILTFVFVADFQVANGMELKTKGDLLGTEVEQQDIKNGCCCTDCFLCCQFADCCCTLGCVQQGLCCNKQDKLPFGNVRN